MRKLSTILIAAAAISSIFSACNKEIIDSKDVQTNSGIVSFVACIDDAATKTTIDGTKVYWNTGDEVSVNGSIFVATVSETNPANATFTLKDGQTAPAEADTYNFYYPATAAGSTAQQFKLPATQIYAGEDISGVNPMFAQTTSLEGKVHFKNVCGLLAIELKGTEKVASIKVTAPSGNYLGGTITNFAYDVDADAISYSSFSRSGSSTSVTLNCAEAVQLDNNEATCFYIAMPAKTYSTLTFDITLETGGKFTFKTTKAATIEKSCLYHLPFTVTVVPVDVNVTLDLPSEVDEELAAECPDESSLAFTISGKDITSFYYLLADSETIDAMYEEDYTAKDLAVGFGSTMSTSYLSQINNGGFMNAFINLDSGTEYAFLYFATNSKGGAIAGDIRKSTTSIDYSGKFKVGDYTMAEMFGTSAFSNTFTISPTKTDNHFVVKDFAIEDGFGWNGVYDEAAGTFTLDGTMYGYESDGNCFGDLLDYFDAQGTMAYGVYVFTSADDQVGAGPCVFSVNENGVIDGLLSAEIDVPVFNLRDGSLAGYYCYYDSDASITYNSAASKVSALKPMPEAKQTIKKIENKVTFNRTKSISKVQR